MKSTTPKSVGDRNDNKLRDMVEHYDQQTDEEGADEIATAPRISNKSWLHVPNELVGSFLRLIEAYERKGSGKKKRAEKPTQKRKKPGPMKAP